MKVLVTGGTGFVGGHVAAAAVRAGHHVRLLVRRPQQVDLTLGPLGVPPENRHDVVVGDVIDEESVGLAIDGCDAVVHAAAVYSLNAAHAEAMRRTNLRAAELVLSAGARAGLDPVVHISSTVAVTRRDGGGRDLPLGDMEGPYARSKIASEQVARRLQDEGSPVVCVYPGGVFGPHDPYRGEQSERLRWLLRGMLPAYPPGSLHSVDARTVADTVVALLEPGRGPRRFVVPGESADADRLYGTVRKVTGRRLPHVVVPVAAILPFARVASFVQRGLPDRWHHYPADPEGIAINASDARFDDTPARTELGIEPVPFEQSIRDTVRWLVESGRLAPRYAGEAMADPPWA